jgi:hypothetical protein
MRLKRIVLAENSRADLLAVRRASYEDEIRASLDVQDAVLSAPPVDDGIPLGEPIETGSALLAVLTPGTQSHAVTEVRTSKGWLIVGSNDRWISLRADGMPASISDVRSFRGRHTVVRAHA